MSLLDTLFGAGGSTDPNFMGPPAPYAPGLFDKLGGVLGGVGSIDPAVAQQLGLDPAQLQHQAAAQALLRFGAGMMANSGPKNGHTPNIFEAIGSGMGAAQQGGQDQLNNALSEAYKSSQLAALKQQQQQAAKDAQSKDALRQQLGGVALDPNFVAATGMDEPTLRMFAQNDPEKFQSLMVAFGNQTAAEKRQDTRDTAAATRQQAQIAEQEKNADRRAAAQLAAQNALPALWRNAPPEELDAYRRKMAGMIGEDGTAPLSKQDQTAINRRVPELQDTITKAQAAMDAIDDVQAKIKTGTYGSRGAGILAGVTGLPLEGPTTMGKDVSNMLLAVQAAQASKGNRNSVLGLTTLKQGKPDPMSPEGSNLSGLADNRRDIETILNNATAEQEHYGNGGTPTTWAATAAQLRAQRKGGAAAAASGGDAGGSRPAGLPASAKQGADGRWYDPASGKVYVQTP